MQDSSGSVGPSIALVLYGIIADVSISGNGHVTTGPDYPAMIAGTQISKILSMIGSWKLVPGLV